MNKQQRQAILIDQLKDTIDELLSLLAGFGVESQEIENAHKILEYRLEEKMDK